MERLVFVNSDHGHREISRREKLVENFYSSSCPNVETIVHQAVSTKLSQTFATIPATLRLFFHDCFAEGCDTSIMIASPKGDAEKDAQDNLSLAGDGFDTDQGKTSSRSSMHRCSIMCRHLGNCCKRYSSPGPSFSVELGRRDGRISLASCAAGNLAKPFFDLTRLNAIFVKNNLTQFDMIALSGAHTVGVSHCNNVENRLCSFCPSSPVDPSRDPNHAQQLMQDCPQNIGPTIVINVDPVTPGTFDNVYYQNLVARKGLFTSDQVLFTNPTSRPTVNDFANNPNEFN
ncbi:Peroxidase 51 [Camellia lanceoleosa]|uniref:Peroxidase 51 n=1 Tax=Camellia lanceoleosa TaxID=1840588 RepID=A0ACC0HUW8_9ERIC|nr:Peroxidase 51 [Camellia lanceoleosa]